MDKALDNLAAEIDLVLHSVEDHRKRQDETVQIALKKLDTKLDSLK